MLTDVLPRLRWIAYSHVDFSGNQYILEKGFYSSCADWGAQDSRICSVQPILLVRTSRNVRTIRLCLEMNSHHCVVFLGLNRQDDEAGGKSRVFVLTDKDVCRVEPLCSARLIFSSSFCQIILYSEPDFQGQCHILDQNREALPEKFQTKSCRVSGGR